MALFFYRASPASQTSSAAGVKQPTTPPRPLTARTWASTTPTILSHAAFTKLCTPTPVSSSSRRGPPVMMPPLEKFLCCMHLKRHLSRVIQGEDPVRGFAWQTFSLAQMKIHEEVFMLTARSLRQE